MPDNQRWGSIYSGLKPLVNRLICVFCFLLAAPFSQLYADAPFDPVARIALTDQEAAFLKEKRHVKMCVDPDWMPLEKIENGRHVGMSADFLEIIEDRIDIPIRLVETRDWSESILFAKERKCDIFSLAMPTPDRLQYMDFTSPYLRIPLVLATRVNEPFIADVTLITDKPLGVVRGYAFGELLRREYPEMQIQDVDSVTHGLELTEQGRIYGFIGALATVSYSLQRRHPELKITGKFDQNWELSVGVRNDMPLLYSIFEKAIETIDPQTHQQIMNRWISVKFETGMDYRIIVALLVFILVISFFFLYRNKLLAKHNRELQKTSETDYLTKIANRKKLDQILAEQVEMNKRYGHTFCVIMSDLDHFKRVNDRFGHLVGDKVLVEFSRLVADQIRRVDTLGRWGGEEFLIICPDTSLEGGGKLAELMRHRIEQHTFEQIGSLTASFGVAEFMVDAGVDNLVTRADDALYKAKSEGRNRVIMSD